MRRCRVDLMAQEKDLEDRLYEVSNIIANAKDKLDEIPLEQWDATLDDILRNLKRINKEVEMAIWLINNPEDEVELS